MLKNDKKNPKWYITGKSMSEALIFASTNPQYDERLFMKIENCKLRASGEHDVYINCFLVFVLTFRTIFVHNMFYPCSAKRRASDKDLPLLILTFDQVHLGK